MVLFFQALGPEFIRMSDEQHIFLELPGSIVVKYWFQVASLISVCSWSMWMSVFSCYFNLSFLPAELSYLYCRMFGIFLLILLCVCAFFFFYLHAFLCVCTWQSKKGHSSSSQREVTVVLPNGQYVVVRCDIKSRARDVFDMVVAHANLVEHFYFGLSFIDGKRIYRMGLNLYWFYW